MASYSISLKHSVLKDLEPLPAKDRVRVMERIGQLAEDPRPLGCERLSALERYRVRVGDYRIVYAIEDERLVVWVVRVGHRRDVYRGPEWAKVRYGRRCALACIGRMGPSEARRPTKCLVRVARFPSVPRLHVGRHSRPMRRVLARSQAAPQPSGASAGTQTSAHLRRVREAPGAHTPANPPRRLHRAGNRRTLR